MERLNPQRGQARGFKHTEATKSRISATMKGRTPLAIHVMRECPTCGVSMNAANMGRHAPACAQIAAKGLFPGKSVKELKTMRRKLRPYGLTPEDYAGIWGRQGGLCSICGGENKVRALAVDHCHRTENVRGLLCDSCNLLLGAARDNPAVLRRAAQYLEQHGAAEPDSCEHPDFDPYKD